MGILLPRKGTHGLEVIESSHLTYFPITLWDIRVIAVLWTLFFVTGIFVVLRLFSRVKILQFYAVEDYLYNVAFVSRQLSHCLGIRTSEPKADRAVVRRFFSHTMASSRSTPITASAANCRHT